MKKYASYEIRFSPSSWVFHWKDKNLFPTKQWAQGYINKKIKAEEKTLKSFTLGRSWYEKCDMMENYSNMVKKIEDRISELQNMEVLEILF